MIVSELKIRFMAAICRVPNAGTDNDRRQVLEGIWHGGSEGGVSRRP